MVHPVNVTLSPGSPVGYNNRSFPTQMPVEEVS